ncbi:MAG TPA: TonB-dependent receptor [Steroidobacteraceae bacterium]|nr:TonB-dependent receptor [Steroidobacteraceae bacterium]
MAGFAPAQPAAAIINTDSTRLQLEDVVVTARRREEPLLAVPIAVSIFSLLELERRQIDAIADLQYAAPSLVIVTDQTNRSTAQVAMRGQFEPMSVPTLDPTVGMYLDGVYIARITGANLRLFDIERVEVLRGPQGTLFGRNTIGGAINLVTSTPASVRAGYVEAGIGNYDRRELAGVVSLPSNDGRYAFRLAASHTEHAGYGRSLLLGRDLNDDRADFARAQMRLAPGGSWGLSFAGDYTRFRNGGQLATLLAAGPLGELVTAASGRPEDDIQNYVDPLGLEVMANRAGSVSTTVAGISATLTYSGEGWTFKSITAGRRLDSEALDSDQDGTPYDLGAVLRRHDEQDQFSQEFQVSGYARARRLDWIAGAHYFLEHGIFDQEFLAFSPLAGGWQVNLPDGSARNDSLAVYAQLGFAIMPSLRITGGLRFNEDGRQLTSRNATRRDGIDSCRLDPALRDSPDICRATLPRRSFSDVPYTLGLDFIPAPRSLLYAKVSGGYRAGGYNLRGATPVDLAPFGPERVTAYEAGARAELQDSRLRIELALFRSYFDDIHLLQRRVAEDGQTHLFIENGGKARIEGGELEFTALLGRLRLSGTLGLVDARYTKLDPDVIQVDQESQFLNAPAATASLEANWPIELPFGRVDLHLDHGWRDDVPFDSARDSVARQQAYGLWNARIRIHLAGPGFCISLWGRNLADKRYITRALDSGVYINAFPGDPRTWGTTIRYPCAE